MSTGAGKSYSCGLRDQGSLYCWGRGEYGQLGNANTIDNFNPQWVRPGPTREFATVSDVFSRVDAGGDGHMCASSYPGYVFCWGNGESGQLGAVERFSSIALPVLSSR